MNDVLGGQAVARRELGIACLAADRAARWIAPSTPPPPPSNDEWAAFTTASIWSEVIFPCRARIESGIRERSIMLYFAHPQDNGYPDLKQQR